MDNVNVQKKFKLLAGTITALCVLYFIAFVAMMVYYLTASAQGYGFLEVFTMLYSQNGITVLFILIIFILIYTSNKRKAKGIKVFFWAMLINSVAFVVPFFSSISAFGTVSPTTLLNFSSAYVPSIMLGAVVLALINVWDNENKKSAKITAIIGVFITAIFNVIFLVMFAQGSFTNFGDICVFLTFLFSNALIVLLCLSIWYICKSNEHFKNIICEKIQDEVKQKTKKIQD